MFLVYLNLRPFGFLYYLFIKLHDCVNFIHFDVLVFCVHLWKLAVHTAISQIDVGRSFHNQPY